MRGHVPALCPSVPAHRAEKRCENEHKLKRDRECTKKRGEIAIQEMAEALDADCQVLLPRSVLPREPDTAVVEQWLMTVHRAWIAGDPALL